jgi:hypothetical protein
MAGGRTDAEGRSASGMHSLSSALRAIQMALPGGAQPVGVGTPPGRLCGIEIDQVPLPVTAPCFRAQACKLVRARSNRWIPARLSWRKASKHYCSLCEVMRLGSTARGALQVTSFPRRAAQRLVIATSLIELQR